MCQSMCSGHIQYSSSMNGLHMKRKAVESEQEEEAPGIDQQRRRNGNYHASKVPSN